MLVAQSCRLFETPWTAAYQVPVSMRFSRQGYWSGLPFPSPGDLSNPGIEAGSLHCRQILYRLSYKGSPHLLGKFSKFVLVVTLRINQAFVSGPPSALLQVNSFSTEMGSPSCSCFFISLMWPPHLLTRSLISWLGWAQLSSVELVPGV